MLFLLENTFEKIGKLRMWFYFGIFDSLILGASFIYQSREQFIWLFSHLLLAWLLFIIGAILNKSHLLRIKVRAFTVLYCLLYIVFYLGIARSYDLNIFGVTRVQFLWDNPNFLASLIVMLNLVLVVLDNGWFMVLTLSISILAIGFTGSRTAMIALVVTLTVTIFSTKHRIMTKLALVSFFALILVFVTSVGRSYISSVDSMLAAPNMFYESEPWVTSYADLIDISIVEDSDVDNTKVLRIKAKSKDTRGLFLLKNIKRSNANTPYIASVYLRSDAPVDLVLSTFFGRTKCHVTTHWERCVTPASLGNGHNYVQWRLETVNPGEYVDFYMWGAQLEEGLEATSYVAKYRPAAKYYLLKRLGFSDVNSKLRQGFNERKQIWFLGWSAFLEQPIKGIGLGSFRQFSAYHSRDGEVFNHAHNAVLHLLAEFGMLGLVSWVVLYIGSFLVIGQRSFFKVLPLVIGVLILNTFDNTFFHSTTFYLYWLMLGMQSGSLYMAKDNSG